MGKVFTHMTMSLDGFIADPDDQVGELFEWYEAGDVTVPNANEDITFEVDEASAEALRDLTENSGALVAGRRLFDIADGWDDKHPVGAPVVVVTHARRRTPPSGGRRRRSSTASRRRSPGEQIAGDKDVTIASANVTQQALDLGLVDEVCVSLVPVLFGRGHPLLLQARPRPPAARGPGRRPGTPRPPPPVPGPSLMSVVAAQAARARAMIDPNTYMTIASADAAGVPWASPVWFAHDQYTEFLWVSRPDARHSNNITARAEVGIVIFDPAGARLPVRYREREAA